MSEREDFWAEAMRAEYRGDPNAYARPLGEVAEAMWRLLRAKLGRLGVESHEVEDVVQEVLVGRHAKRHSWNADRTILLWLNAVARYKLVDAVRRLRREARRHIGIRPEDWADMVAASQEEPDRGLLHVERHIRDLPRSQREVGQALTVEERFVRATAVHLRTSVGTVRMPLHRALARLVAFIRTAGVSQFKVQR